MICELRLVAVKIDKMVTKKVAHMQQETQRVRSLYLFPSQQKNRIPRLVFNNYFASS